MKKLIIITGAFLIICVIISAFFDNSAMGYEQQSASEQTQALGAEFTVKTANGKICVYQDDSLLYRTNTAVNTLPKKDQKDLLYGIQADTLEDVEQILMEYCS